MMDEILPDIGPVNDPPEKTDPLPGFDPPEGPGAMPTEFEQLAEQAQREREADKFVTHSFHDSEQMRHQWNRDFNEEILKTFELVGKDIADYHYALQDLRTRMEADRGDLSDFGL